MTSNQLEGLFNARLKSREDEGLVDTFDAELANLYLAYIEAKEKEMEGNV